jgi:uncharacterized protein involved in outer membrane biogenesis
MKRLVIIVAVTLVAILAALLVVPSLIDWNGYRGEMERQASRMFGRPVRVGGNVSLQLLPTPYVSIADVRIAGDDGRFSRPFLKIGALTVRLSVPPLLKGEIEASDVIIEEPELQLAVDASGRGNWRGFGTTQVALPLMPKTVALSSVRIERGRVRLMSAAGASLWELQAVNGELAAPALIGPYRFKGSFASSALAASGGSAERQELRLSTGVLNEPQGARLKIVTTRPAPAADMLSFDGLVRNLEDQPRLEGAIVGNIVSLTAQDADGKYTSSSVELSAQLQADMLGAKLADIVASVPAEQGSDGKTVGRTQEIKGSASAEWDNGGAWTMDLSTRWVDLERLLPKTTQPLASDTQSAATNPATRAIPLSPAERLAAVIAPLVAALPNTARFRLRGAAEEAELANGRIVDLRLDVSRKDDVLTLETLTAGLPGNSRIELSGRVARFAPAVSGVQSVSLDFEGPIHVQGASLQRLAEWARFNGRRAPSPVDRPFLVDGTFAWSAAAIRAEKLRAEIAGTVVTGHWRSQSGPDAAVDVALDTDSLDLRGLWVPPDNAADLLALLPLVQSSMAQNSATASGTTTGTDSASADAMTVPANAVPAVLAQAGPLSAAKINVRIGHLQTDQGALRDVALAATQDGENLAITTLKARSELGFAFDGQGTIARPGSSQTGALTFALAIDTPNAVAALSDFFTVQVPAPSPGFIGTLLPMQLAGSYTRGTTVPGGSELALDGSANGARVVVSSRGDSLFRAPAPDGGLPVSITVQLTNDDGLAVASQVQQLLGFDTTKASVDASATPASSIEPGALSLRLEGNVASGMHVLAQLDAGANRGEVTGLVRRPDSGADWSLSGKLMARGDDPRYWADLLGLPKQIDLQSEPVSVAADLYRDAQSWRLANGKAQLGAQAAEFALNVPRVDDPTLPFDLEIKTTEFDAVAATELVLAPRSRDSASMDVGQATVGLTAAPADPAVVPVPVVPTPASESQTMLWSQSPFDFARFKRPGHVKLAAQSLTVAPGVTVRGATVDVLARNDGVTINSIDGEVFGGKLAMTASLKKQPAGAALSLNAELTGVAIDELAGDMPSDGDRVPRAQASVDLDVSASSTGLDPRGLVALLSGSGRLRIGAGVLNDMSPLAVDAAARAVLTDRSRLSPDVLKQLMARGRLIDQFPLLPTEAAMKILDGKVTIEPLRFDTAASQLQVTTAIDLETARADSEWMLTPKRQADAQAVLPPVTLIYVGALSALSEIEPRIDVGALERELIARRVLGGDAMLAGLSPDVPPERTIVPVAPQAATPLAPDAPAAPEKAPPAASKVQRTNVMPLPRDNADDLNGWATQTGD